jgi:HNH endonuclease
MHWRRLEGSGGSLLVKTTAELFWPRVDVGWTHDCWEWMGPTLNNGYGQFGSGKNRGVSTLAHRASYQLVKGDPGDLVIDHLCRNRKCVNPQHLEAVTQETNVHRERDANKGNRGQGYNSNKDKTHCVNGHSNWKQYSYRRKCLDCAKKRG